MLNLTRGNYGIEEVSIPRGKPTKQIKTKTEKENKILYKRKV